MSLSVIAAVAENAVIGHENRLPWHLPADLKRFKQLTLGHPILMGRRTWESIGRPLPGRRSVVITGNRSYEAPGAEVAHSLADAVAACDGTDEAFVIGGASLFREALAKATRVYLTRVHATPPGDVWFPEESLRGWRVREEIPYPADERHAHAMTFYVLERPASP